MMRAYMLNKFRSRFELLWTITIVLGVFLVFGFLIGDESEAITASYFVFLIAYASSIVFALSISEDKETGTLRMIKTTKLSKKEYLFSKFIMTNLAAFLIGMIIMSFGMFYTEIYISVPSVMFVVFLTAFSHAGPGIIIASVARKKEHVRYLTSLIMIGMLLVSPVFYATDNIPETFKLLQNMIPLTHIIEVARLLMVDNQNFSKVMPSSIVLTVFGLVTLVYGYERFDF